MSQLLTLGFVAHVDAGKTSLTERLLFASGALEEIGSVDAGNTQTDSLPLERARGITIRSAVASFAIGNVGVNLLDTPGHPDFIAEVERGLGVLDGAVLIVSAVEGVQPQTRILMRALQRLRIPTLIFVNKIDRSGADGVRTFREIEQRLTDHAVAMGSVRDVGTRAAQFVPSSPEDADAVARLVDALGDEALLERYLRDPASLTPGRLLTALARCTRAARVHPVLFGSAITGAGTDELLEAIADLLAPREQTPDGPLSATVFKVERGPSGEKLAYLRMFSGTLRVRDRVDGDKVTRLSVFDRGPAAERAVASAGQIAKVRGLDAVRVGDVLGVPPVRGRTHHFAPPTLETVVVPVHPRDKGVMFSALSQLAEQDPLIGLRQDDLHGEIAVSLYGEVQKEIIEAMLADDFGVAVTFRETTTICIERLVGTGAAFEIIDVAPNPFLATVGLRLEPAPIGSGVTFRLEVELGSMPAAFFTAIEETVRGTCRQGLYGWEIPDCTITLTHTGYWPRQSHMHGKFDKSMSSTAGDFRGLTPLVFMDALRQAGTRVHEPVHRYRLDIPADSYGALLPTLTALRAAPLTATPSGTAYLLEGTIPAGCVHELQRELPPMTRGEGVLETEFDHYRPVRGPQPARARTDADPLDRRKYLLAVLRRVPT